MPEPRPDVHPAAAVGFQRAAAVYERSRPGFPEAAIRLLVRELDLREGRTLLELAAGTGKLTRLLAPTGARILAVEPVAAMRGHLDGIAGVAAVDAVAESIPLPDRSVDAAVGAQAFHWFDNGRVIQELDRLLSPGGAVGLVWNVRDESVQWVAGLTELMAPYRGDTPSHRSMRWRAAWDVTDRFEPLRLTTFAYAHPVTVEGVVDRVLSVSFMATLPSEERVAAADRVRALVPDDPGLRFPYRTEVWLTRRRA
jgi:SAM-dependent methyltransferase